MGCWPWSSYSKYCGNFSQNCGIAESVPTKNRDLDVISGLDKSLLKALRQVIELCPFASDASVFVGALGNKWMEASLKIYYTVLLKKDILYHWNVNIILEDKQILLFFCSSMMSVAVFNFCFPNWRLWPSPSTPSRKAAAVLCFGGRVMIKF